MPRYYFHVRWPGRKDDDPTGMWLADDATARDYAERLIGEMKEREGHDPSLSMAVERAGTVLFTIKNTFPDRRDVGDLLA
jgi:hypothetical protein